MQDDNGAKGVNPGIHSHIDLKSVTLEEQEIIQRLSSEWYITKIGDPIQLSKTSTYRFFLAKPTATLKEAFNLDREIICVFSPFSTFEPRTLDAFDAASKTIQGLRTETVCQVLISRDLKIEEKIANLIKGDPEQPVVIPFNYTELMENKSKSLVSDRFRKHFYSRDLFSFQSPLTKDLYFFGRTALVQDLTSRFRSHENSAIFGLRKSGKTSIIYGVERALRRNEEPSCLIDCESPSVHGLRWNELLHRLVVEAKRAKDTNISTSPVDAYTEKNAADAFEADMIKIYEAKKRQPLLIVLDEIERIAPDTSSSRHWKEEKDFVLFWQTIRAFFQRHREICSFLIVGTSPSVLEKSSIHDDDNPIFCWAPINFIAPFTLDQTREMVRTLGQYMGLLFEPDIYHLLQTDFGGHAFLIRHVCSEIHKIAGIHRPVNIDRTLYSKAKSQFEQKSAHYIEMVVDVLAKSYPDEYTLLQYLALDDFDAFNAFISDTSASHLLGYEIVKRGTHGYYFQIEIVKKFLQQKYKHQKFTLTPEEKLAEISERIIHLERTLRRFVRQQLQSLHGKVEATNKTLASLPSDRRTKLTNLSLEDLYSDAGTPLFLLDLRNIIHREWDAFKHVFELTQQTTCQYLDELNEIRRSPAHAKDIQDGMFQRCRLNLEQLNRSLSQFGR